MTDRHEADFAWLADNGPQLCEQYAGKWIAVRDGKVIGVGDTAVEAAEQARKSTDNKEDDFILEAIDASADVIYVGDAVAT
jgi:hypothetical protein